jgi:hypothetical protein
MKLHSAKCGFAEQVLPTTSAIALICCRQYPETTNFNQYSRKDRGTASIKEHPMMRSILLTA